ncbi:MAG TPA: single-stranded-DNA-specific exonuclease RecJ [Syntrophorhabdaceae bacterium]|nr:single-stranded-DNA-specific exonuclease RecJ [Syntrophorhabdaceae bacterium]
MVDKTPQQKTDMDANRNDKTKSIQSITDDLNVPDLIARILVARGIESPVEASLFLNPRLEDLSDPSLMPDMEKGVARVIQAVTKKETVCLYGDYDADGVTSLVLMMNFLKHFDMDPITYIPTRQEGYGLNVAAIDLFREKNVKLLISLDCGSSNIDEVGYATAHGIDTVIIDHHEAGETLPDAHAIINPKRKDSRFPTRDLAACGTVFFFLLALRREIHRQGLLLKSINLKRELDLVAIGSIGDMVPLTGDNRIMVKHGMEIMNKHPKAWLKSFFKSGAITRGIIDEFALGFIIVPRINATGRVSNPDKSLHFLAAADEATAAMRLSELQQANVHRQRIEEATLKEILAMLKRDGVDHRKTIVVFSEKWHIGILGIVAQKLAEMHKKPAIVITKLNDVWKGSGRGVGGMDLYETISSLSHMLLKYGGHKYACGVSLVEKNLSDFADAFEKSAETVSDAGRPRVFCDTGAEFEELTAELMRHMDRLSPFGIGNPRPNMAFNPSRVTPMSGGRVKIVDRNKRTWYGYIQQDLTIPRSENIYFIASPVLRQEMGEQFVNLNIKEIAETPFYQ